MVTSRRRCNLDGQPLSEHDQAQVDAFAAFLKAQVIEDESGAPLPGRLQRNGDVWRLLHEWVETLTPRDLEWPHRTTDDLAVKLAPLFVDES